MKAYYGGFVVYEIVKKPWLRTMIVTGDCRIGMRAVCAKLATLSSMKQRGCGETA